MRNRRLIVLGAIALAVASCGGRVADGGNGGNVPAAVDGAVAEGQAIYEGSCVACHAEGGVGVEGLGRPLAHSDFIRGLSDSELVTFIEVGRDSSDPENTSGIAMPAKGGNPSLTTADIEVMVVYLRSLN